MFLVKDNKASDSIITSLSPIAAFKILGMKPTENKKLIQMGYHKSVMELQEKETAAMKFTNMRAAYEVIIKYIENPEKPEETIDVSYLLEAIEKLACLQEIESRYRTAQIREYEFRENHPEIHIDADESDQDDEQEIEVPDFGYPDYRKAEELLKNLESMHFKSEQKCPDSILAEAYYEMIFVCRMMHVKKGVRAVYLNPFDYAKKALDKEKSIEYLYWCGYLLSQSRNMDSIEQAISYLSEAEKDIEGHFREGSVYWWLAYCYDYKEDFKNAFVYAKKATEYYPENIEAYRILGGTAYDLLMTTSNRMYADAAVKAFAIALSGVADFWEDTLVHEKLCKIYTRSSNWGMLEKICGRPETTLLNNSTFPA